MKHAARLASRLRNVSIIFAAMISISACATPKPENSIDLPSGSLVETPHRFFDEAKLKPGASFAKLKKVFVADATASFDKRWIREYRGKASTSYQKRIIKEYSALLTKELKTELTELGYEITTEKSAAQLVIMPSIDRLIIHGPDDGFNDYLITNAGIASLVAHIESPEGQLMAYYKDRRETRDLDFHRPEKASRATNYRDFKWLMKRWAKRLGEDLSSRI